MPFSDGKLLAQYIDLKPGRGIAGQVEGLSFSALIVTAVNALFVIAVVIFFFMLVLGGIRWISSGGDKGQTEGAKSQITSAIIGLVITLSAYAIVQLIGLLIGVPSIFNLLVIEQVAPDESP